MHWYNQNGQPCYEMPKADGKGTRPTTLRDARKHLYVPSVTTICQTAAKPGLDRWKHKQLLSIVEQYKTLVAKQEPGWEDKLLALTKDKLNRVINTGNEVHNALEQVFINGAVDETKPYEVFVQPVKQHIDKVFPDIQWISEGSFASIRGYGGKIDLHSKCGNYVIDFKTKDVTDLSSIEMYDDYIMQLAAYREGLRIPNAKCLNIFISNSVPNVFRVWEWEEEALKRGLQMFHCLLQFWKLQHNYESGWIE